MYIYPFLRYIKKKTFRRSCVLACKIISGLPLLHFFKGISRRKRPRWSKRWPRSSRPGGITLALPMAQHSGGLGCIHGMALFFYSLIVSLCNLWNVIALESDGCKPGPELDRDTKSKEFPSPTLAVRTPPCVHYGRVAESWLRLWDSVHLVCLCQVLLNLGGSGA